jgi:hypothetical protein
LVIEQFCWRYGISKSSTTDAATLRLDEKRLLSRTRRIPRQAVAPRALWPRASSWGYFQWGINSS